MLFVPKLGHVSDDTLMYVEDTIEDCTKWGSFHRHMADEIK